MFMGKLYVNGVYSLKVSQNLLGVKGSKIEDIRCVISHNQALEQCAKFIQNHNWETKSFCNTARAAKEVAELTVYEQTKVTTQEEIDQRLQDIFDTFFFSCLM